MQHKRVEVKLDSNKLNAFLIFHPVEGFEAPLTTEETNDAIKMVGIKYGIDESKIDFFIKQSLPNVPVPFAKGIPPIEGEDSRLVYNFDMDKLKLYSSGKITRMERNMYKTFLVKKGELLVKKIPLKEGKKGVDIFGNDISPKIPKDASLIPLCGENTVIGDDSLRLVSASDGIVKFTQDKFAVDKILVIAGDVDPSVGNIDFEGTVIIEGTVKSGFIIKAKEDIKVEGVVEGATLISGRDIEIHSGVKGRGKTYFSSGRDIKVKFVENSEIDAARDLIIDSSAVNSKLKARRMVRTSGEPGEVIGGSISAGQMVDVQTIGSSMNIKTTIEVGVDPALKEKLALLKSQVAIDRENLVKLTKIVKKLRDMKLAMKDQFPKDKLVFLVKSVNSINTLNSKLPVMEKEIGEIEERIEVATKEAKIVVRRTLHAGSEVSIRDRKFYVTRQLDKVMLVLEKDEIRVGGFGN